MIASWRSRALKRFFEKGDDRGIRPDWRLKLEILLDALDVAEAPEDLNTIGAGFHRLKGKPTRWAVSVSPNWRLTFGWDGEDAVDVDLEDYHGK
jgi:proteic killer suppression protein